MASSYHSTLPARAAVLFLGFFAAAGGALADSSDEVFDPAVIGQVWLTIPNASWTPIDNEALTACEPHPRSYYRGAIRLGNEEFPGSGLRIKGGCGSSRTSASGTGHV